MKRSLSLATAFLTITLLSFCSNPDSSKKAVQIRTKASLNDTVTLIIDSARLKTAFADLFFYYHDSLYQSHGIGMKSGQVHFSLNSPAILIDAVNNQTPYLVNPGETIHIKNAGTDSIGMYIPDNPRRTNELDFFRKMVKKTGEIWYFVPSMHYHGKVNALAQIHDLERKISDVKNTRLQFLADYAKQHPLSDGFIITAAKCIKITAISDSLYLHRRNQIMLAKQNLYKPLVAAKTASIERIGFMPNQFFYRACSDLVQMIGSTSNNSSEFIRFFDFIDQNFTGLNRDYLLAKAVYSDFKNKVRISKDELSKFDAECGDKGYRNQIHKILDDNSIALVYAKGTNKLLSPDGKTVQDMDTVLAKHKGKLILLDFWASWCSPCRREMPFAATLKKRYKDKNVVFITVSTDSDISGWKKAAKDEGLESDNDFLLLNSEQAPFIKHYGINLIPRYMLIGKDGKVITDNSPRPSDPKLGVLINRYL
jgi:thiol-disulfide isomerase/thioredoxin